MYDLVAATLDLPILIICRWNSSSDFERRRLPFRSQNSTSIVYSKCAIGFPLNTRRIILESLIT